LALLAPDLDVDARDATIEEQAKQLGPAGTTRALEVIGDAVTSMKEAVDARVALETALVRLCRADLDVAPSALLERIDRLERRLESAGRGEAPEPAKAVAPPPAATRSAGVARPPLRMEKAPSPKVEAAPPPATEAAPLPEGELPDRESLTLAWGDTILDQLKPGVKAKFRGGRWVDAPTPTFALPTDIHRKRCEEFRLEVQEALSAHFGVRVPLTLVTDGSTLTRDQPTRAVDKEDVVEDVGDVSELEDAGPVASGAARLLEAFPGAVEEE
jgi:hypothetical protein